MSKNHGKSKTLHVYENGQRTGALVKCDNGTVFHSVFNVHTTQRRPLSMQEQAQMCRLKTDKSPLPDAEIVPFLQKTPCA